MAAASPAVPKKKKRGELPIFSSLTGYQLAWIVGDIIAGITLVAIAIPEQMATAQLAGMPVQTGLYAFICGGLAIAIFGSSRQMSVGADSTIAPIFAAGVAGIAAVGTAAYTQDIILLALMVGAILIAVGLLRMGWIADLLSTPVTTGFLAGIGVTIIVGQLPDMFGVSKGTGSYLEQVIHIFQEYASWNWYAIAISVVVLAIVIVSERINPKIPGALIGLILSLVASVALDLPAKGVAVLGALPQGLPPVAVPTIDMNAILPLLPIALTVVLVCLMQTAATSRSFADLGGYDVNMNKDFIAIGVGSVAASFVGSFPIDSSPPRTAVVASSGGRSQVASLVAVGVIVLLIVFFATALTDLPKATLGAILTFVGSRIIHVRALAAVLPYDRFEFALAIFTLFAVIVLGTEYGILIAIVLALLERTRLSARPYDAVLGKVAGTTSWVALRDELAGAAEIPGVKVIAFGAPLYFANASTFRDRMRAVIDADDAPKAIVFDAEAADDIDFTGAAAVTHVAEELKRRQIVFAIARLRADAMPENVKPSDLGIPADSIFDTIDDAVSYVLRVTGQTPAPAPDVQASPPAAPEPGGDASGTAPSAGPA
jgi:sulfate permease, SulP family